MKFSIFSVADHYPGRARTLPQFYQQIIAEARLADTLGYDSFFVAEHHFHEVGAVPNPAILLAALARETQRLRLGVAVANLGLRNPLTVAEDYAMVDVLCNGRLTLGVGSGYLAHEFAGLRTSLDDKRERFDENLAVLRQALSGGKVTFQGRYNDIPGVALNVQPLQSPLPVYVAIRRKEAACHVGRQGLPMFSLPCTCLDSFQEIAGLVGEYRRGQSEAGMQEPAEVILAFHTHVAASDDAARERASGALNLYFDTRLAYKIKQDYDMVLGKGLSMTGSAPSVAARLIALQRMGVGHVMLLQNFGNLDPTAVQDSMQRIAHDVMPLVRQAAHQPALRT